MGDSEKLGTLFDPEAELLINQHYRPHWSQAGAIVFITFRTADSLPREVIKRWETAKQEWMKKLGMPPGGHWKPWLSKVSEDERQEFHRHFNRTREMTLDSCRGECVMRQRRLAKIVADTLLYFDKTRYRLGDFIVMPNHVHLLVAFASADTMAKQCSSWLHFSARQINIQLGRKGKFWQQEPFDHLVRSQNQLVYLRKYIRDNGVKAGLPESDYLYRCFDELDE